MAAAGIRIPSKLRMTREFLVPKILRNISDRLFGGGFSGPPYALRESLRGGLAKWSGDRLLREVSKHFAQPQRTQRDKQVDEHTSRLWIVLGFGLDAYKRPFLDLLGVTPPVLATSGRTDRAFEPRRSGETQHFGT
jgi:hypothetical protein